MAKKANTPLQVVNGKTTPKKEEKTTVQAAKTSQTEPTKEDLLKRVGELEKQLSTVPKNLDEKIQYFNRKKELITRLARLKAWKENLNEHVDKLAEISAQNEFETEEYILTIESGSNYNKKSVFKLDNPVIIGDAIGFIVGMIEGKQKNIQAEIEA